MENNITEQKKIFTLMFFAMISWGIAWTSASILNDYLDYFNLVFLRFLCGFISLLPFVYRKLNLMVHIKTTTMINIIFMSILFFIYNYCFFKGTHLGNPGFGGVFVTTTNPVITFIIISLITRNITINRIAGIFTGVVGGLIILNVFSDGYTHLLSDKNKYFILCSLIWGVMTVLMSYGQKKIDSLLYITICYFSTTIIAFFFADVTKLNQIFTFDIIFYINFFLASIGAMSFGTSMYIYATPRLGPIQTSVFIFSVPFIALITANIVLGESITYNVIIGGILSMVSIFIVNKN